MDKPEVPQKAPYIVDLKAGKYAWCSCGLSKNQPYCDGAHKGTDFTPVRFELDQDRKVALCGCKNSANGAFCDGAHSNL